MSTFRSTGQVREHFLICTERKQNIYVLAISHGSMDLPNRVAELEPVLLDEAEILHRTFLKAGRRSR